MTICSFLSLHRDSVELSNWTFQVCRTPVETTATVTLVFQRGSIRFAFGLTNIRRVASACFLSDNPVSYMDDDQVAFGDTADDLSLDSEDLRLPLPENVDEDAGETVSLGNEQGSLAETDGYASLEDTQAAENADTGGELDEQSKANLRSMIEDSCLAAKPVFNFQMPWERKGLMMVFDRKPKQLIPTPVIKPVDFPSSSRCVPPANPLPSERTMRGAYSEVINFKCSMTEQEVEENASRKALEVWYLIFSSGQESWPQGFDLRQSVELHRLDDMKLIVGNKSPSTIARRGMSVLAFIKWYRAQYFAMCPFPTDAKVMEEYVIELQRNQRPVSAIRSFLEAANFCQFYLKMTFVVDQREMVTAKVKRIVEVSDEMKPEKKQARVLTVREVEFLETCLADERLDRTDRVACGCMLFCLYSRSRWSDLRKIYGFVTDVRGVSGHISGYLECRTRSHKTSRQIAKSGLAMPLVAPLWGLLTPPWGLGFVKLCEVAQRPLSLLDQEPLLAAPNPDGQWSKRSVTTTEAGKWIRNLLIKLDSEVEYTTIHSLKATPLYGVPSGAWSPMSDYFLDITALASNLPSATHETIWLSL